MWINLFYHFILFTVFLIIFYAAILNFRHIEVSNSLIASLLLLYPLIVMTAPFEINWIGAVLVAIGAFLIGFLFSSLNIIRVSDIKFVSAICLWAGPQMLVEFLSVTISTSSVLVLFFMTKEGVRQAQEGTGFARGIKFALWSKTPIPLGTAVTFGAIGVLLSYEQIINLSL